MLSPCIAFDDGHDSLLGGNKTLVGRVPLGVSPAALSPHKVAAFNSLLRLALAGVISFPPFAPLFLPSFAVASLSFSPSPGLIPIPLLLLYPPFLLPFPLLLYPPVLLAIPLFCFVSDSISSYHLGTEGGIKKKKKNRDTRVIHFKRILLQLLPGTPSNQCVYQDVQVSCACARCTYAVHRVVVLLNMECRSAAHTPFV